MRLRVALLAAILLGASLFATISPPSGARIARDDTSHAGMRLRIGERIPPMLFEDQQGQPFLLQALRGETVILAFVCTRCRDAGRCEGISGEFAYLQHRLPPGIRLVEITFDPARDTNEVLAAYARRFGADPERWTLATDIDVAAVTHFASAFGMSTPGDGALLPSVHPAHIDRITLLDANGRVSDVLDDGGARDPQVLLREARAVAGLRVSPAVQLHVALRRLWFLPPRTQRAIASIAFASPVGLFLIGLVFRSVFIALLRRSRTRALPAAIVRPARH